MKAMILAAGLGTRLKPMTDFMPKALVEVNGVPVLERTISFLKKEGVEKISLNVHHFSCLIIDYLKRKDFGIEIQISDESERLLDTGGGLVKAYDINFGTDKTPLLVHNVDIISNADIKKLLEAHLTSSSDITLLISDRRSSRKLIFDEDYYLKGWHRISDNIFLPENFKNNENYNEYAFSGIYIINKEAVEEMREIMGIGKFSIMDYLLNVDRKCVVKGYFQENLELIDIGKPAGLEQASEFLLKNNLAID